MSKRRIAILLELPSDDQNGMAALRLFLKGILKSFGIKCLSIRDTKDTVTFASKGADNDQ